MPHSISVDHLTRQKRVAPLSNDAGLRRAGESLRRHDQGPAIQRPNVVELEVNHRDLPVPLGPTSLVPTELRNRIGSPNWQAGRVNRREPAPGKGSRRRPDGKKIVRGAVVDPRVDQVGSVVGPIPAGSRTANSQPVDETRPEAVGSLQPDFEIAHEGMGETVNLKIEIMDHQVGAEGQGVRHACQTRVRNGDAPVGNYTLEYDRGARTDWLSDPKGETCHGGLR